MLIARQVSHKGMDQAKCIPLLEPHTFCPQKRRDALNVY